MTNLSFRTRLAVRWAVAFGLLLALANTAIWIGSSVYAARDLRAHLNTLAGTELASTVDEYRGVHLHDFPASTLDRREYADKFVQLLAADGRLLTQSRLLRDSPPLVSEERRRAALAGAAPVFAVRVDGRPGLMTALPVAKDGETYVVAVGLFTDWHDALLRHLAWLLVAIWLVGVALTTALGFALASRTLVPIDRITQRAAAIARGDFSARLDPPAVDDDIGRMTRLLNDMLERLHQALEANRRFAADAAHELRGPLTAIQGEIDVTLLRTRTAGEYQETLRLLHARAADLARLTDDLMLLVRAQEGRVAARIEEVPLSAVLRAAARRHLGVAGEREVSLRFDAFPDLVAYADAGLLARLFDNLVRNAIRYNRDRGEVVFRGRVEDRGGGDPPRVAVQVSDTGIGIPPDDRERIFERFYRSDRSRSRDTGGTGLGLSICREIAALLGGGIRLAESTPAGSTFEVVLPGIRASSAISDGAIADSAGPARATAG